MVGHMHLKIQWRFNGYFSMEISWKQFMFGDMKMHYLKKIKI
jgi:hypothetical protein